MMANPNDKFEHSNSEEAIGAADNTDSSATERSVTSPNIGKGK